MSFIVSNLLASLKSAAENSPDTVAAAHNLQPADAVGLSEAQQVLHLYNQGLGVLQIADHLHLTESAVNSYLGVSSDMG